MLLKKNGVEFGNKPECACKSVLQIENGCDKLKDKHMKLVNGT